MSTIRYQGLPRLFSCEESVCQCRKWRYCPLVGKIPCRRKWQPSPVFLPGESHGQKSLAGCSPWGHKRVKHDLATKQLLFTCSLVPSSGSCRPWKWMNHSLSFIYILIIPRIRVISISFLCKQFLKIQLIVLFRVRIIEVGMDSPLWDNSWLL